MGLGWYDLLVPVYRAWMGQLESTLSSDFRLLKRCLQVVFQAVDSPLDVWLLCKSDHSFASALASHSHLRANYNHFQTLANLAS